MTAPMTKGELVAALADWDDDTPLTARCCIGDGIWLEGDRIQVHAIGDDLVLKVDNTGDFDD